MKRINGIILLIFLAFTGCASTVYEGQQQTRGNGLDMNLVANTILATALYNSSNNNPHADFERNFNNSFGSSNFGNSSSFNNNGFNTAFNSKNKTITETHKTGTSTSNTVGTSKTETYTQPYGNNGTMTTTTRNSNSTTHSNSVENTTTKSRSFGTSIGYNPFGF